MEYHIVNFNDLYGFYSDHSFEYAYDSEIEFHQGKELIDQISRIVRQNMKINLVVISLTGVYTNKMKYIKDPNLLKLVNSVRLLEQISFKKFSNGYRLNSGIITPINIVTIDKQKFIESVSLGFYEIYLQDINLTLRIKFMVK